MPLDLQAVDEEESTLDLQPVEEPVPVPPITPPAFTIPPGPADGGIPRSPEERAAETVRLNRVAGLTSEGGYSSAESPLINFTAENFPLPSTFMGHPLPASVREFEGGVSESLATTATGLTTPENLVTLPAYALPVVGPALMLAQGAKALGAGAGTMTEAIRQRDPRLAGEAEFVERLKRFAVQPSVNQHPHQKQQLRRFQVPYNAKQRRFFNLCKNNPEKARGKCPPAKDSAKLANEANRLHRKKKSGHYRPVGSY